MTELKDKLDAEDLRKMVLYGFSLETLTKLNEAKQKEYLEEYIKIMNTAHDQIDWGGYGEAVRKIDGPRPDLVGPMPTEEDPNLDWALYYHALGFNPIPIGSKGDQSDNYKKPIINEWKPYQKKRTTVEEIEAWWGKWPTANIGLLCGSISGMVVLDVDVDKGGFESMGEITPEKFNPREDLRTPMVQTGRAGGGFHFYFRSNKIINKITDLLPGLDFQGEGSYVIAPPSVHYTGNYYSWLKGIDEFPLMDVPEWLLRTIEDYHKDKAKKTPNKKRTEKGVMKVGNRNNTLTSLSGELYNKGYPPDVIKKVLHAVNNEIAEDPLPNREVDAIKTSWPKRKFSDNDVGNAERMVHYFGNRFLYNPQEDQFHIWDGCRWAKDDMNVIWELANETIKNITKVELEGVDDEKDRNRLYDLAKSSFSNNKLKGMINCLKTQPEIKVNGDHFDRNKYLLCCKNGTLDLQNMEFRENRQEDYITMMADVEYDQDAKSELWDNFIEKIIPYDDVRLFVQKIAGLCLNGLILEQRYYAVYGLRDNGKSVFTGALRSIMGDYGQITPFTTFEKRKTQSNQARSDVVRMKNKRLIVVHEIPADANRLDDNLIKALTGADDIAQRGLYKEEVEFKSTGKLLFDGNHKLKYYGHEESFVKRTIFIHFDITIPEKEQDKELPEKLKDPYVKSAILNWMFRGWEEYRKDIQQNKVLTIPPKVATITQTTNLENDPVGFFLKTACEINEGNIKLYDLPKIQAFELYLAYEHYCLMEGISKFSNTKFGRIMVEKGIKKGNESGKVYYYGIKVKDDWKPPPKEEDKDKKGGKNKDKGRKKGEINDYTEQDLGIDPIDEGYEED